jgi:hypothetical protein
VDRKTDAAWLDTPCTLQPRTSRRHARLMGARPQGLEA